MYFMVFMDIGLNAWHFRYWRKPENESLCTVVAILLRKRLKCILLNWQRNEAFIMQEVIEHCCSFPILPCLKTPQVNRLTFVQMHKLFSNFFKIRVSSKLNRMKSCIYLLNWTINQFNDIIITFSQLSEIWS